MKSDIVFSSGLHQGVVFETAHRFGGCRAAKIVRSRDCSLVARDDNRFRRIGRIRVERMRAIGKADQHVHLGTQFDIIAAVGTLGLPAEAAGLGKAHGREEIEDAGKIATGKTELAGDEDQVVAGVARLFTRIFRRVRGSGRAAHQAVMSAGTVLDHREHDAAHIGEDHAALAERRCPLDLCGIDEIDPFAGIGGAPGDERDGGIALRLIDADRLAARDFRRPVPATGDGFLVDDGGGVDRRRRQGAGAGQRLGGEFQPLLLMLLISCAVGGDFFG
ncbi:hypothetical protein RHECNPAF_9300145 [Rhizobium etli CNPAF512]|nr:hypothetical protein RHECNPAF_9300145 [Rhizobium etli CNPAF512]